MNCLYSGDKPLGIVQSNAEDVAYDSNTSVKEAIVEVQESIAPVVESPTTSAISSGSHFMYNGVRMVATSAIGSGATLVVYPTTGYNCKAESVEEYIKGEVSNSNGSVRIRKVGNIGYLYIDRIAIQFNADGKVVNYTVPEGYRPKYFSVYLTKVYNGSAYVDCEVDVTTDGQLRITDLFGNAINGIQTQYIKQFVFTYYL